MTGTPHPRLLRILLVALAALAAVTVVPAPASAISPSLSIPSQISIAATGCTDIPFSFDADPPAEYSDVSVVIAIHGADGGATTSVSRSAASGSGSLTVCSTVPDTYGGQMSVTACSADHTSCTTYNAPVVSFQYGTPTPPPPEVTYALRVTLKTSVKPKWVLLTVARQLRGSDGSTTADPGAVQLQFKAPGTWVTVLRQQTTRHGTTTFRVPRFPEPVKVRATTHDHGALVKSTVVTIKSPAHAPH